MTSFRLTAKESIATLLRELHTQAVVSDGRFDIVEPLRSAPRDVVPFDTRFALESSNQLVSVVFLRADQKLATLRVLARAVRKGSMTPRAEAGFDFDASTGARWVDADGFRLNEAELASRLIALLE